MSLGADDRTTATPRERLDAAGGGPSCSLYDNHVAELLEQALHPVEHPRPGLHDTPADVAVAAITSA